MNPACSIVIRTLNEARYLGLLLEKIKEQSYPENCVEVIVVDSGSTDGTLQIAEKYKCKLVTLERAQFSFGRSLNLGCAVAQGAVLVFVSGHCVPATRDWLWSLVSPLHDPQTAVTYGRQEGGPGTKFSEHMLFQKYFPSYRENGQSAFFCNNANLAMKKEAWKQHGFDEALTGLEDMHTARKIVQQGFRVEYVPEASVYHYHHEKWSQVKRRYEREAIALQAIMPEVHLHWHDAIRYFIAAVLGDGSEAVAQGVFFIKICEIIRFRFCQYHGAWKGNHLHRQLSHREKEKYFYPN